MNHAATAPLMPLDIRLMNTAASALFAVFALVLAAAAVRGLAQLPEFSIRGITLTGDLNHNNTATLRANVAPRLSGTFFTVDLARVRAAFESVPWVRQAVVRREFPNRLRVELQEHRAVAYWGTEPELRLVNTFGEVFEANMGEVEQDALPKLSGPDGQSSEVLGMYRSLAPLWEDKGLALEQLDLTGRGSWRAQLEGGAVIELGRGSPDEVTERVQRFLHTFTQVTARFARTAQAIESADLRHANGYAIKLRGISTVAVDAGKKGAQ